MSHFAVIVDFHVAPECRASFRHLVDANAQTTLETETKCRHFDVIEPKDEADRLILYEVYDDEAAFHEHMRTFNYEKFESETASMVRSKRVTQGSILCAKGQPV